jgi:hypothetical protein
MSPEAPIPKFIPVRCAPQKAPCPRCGTRGTRKRTCTRTVRTIAYKAIVFLEITYGEYEARCDCCTTFRNTRTMSSPRPSMITASVTSSSNASSTTG